MPDYLVFSSVFGYIPYILILHHNHTYHADLFPFLFFFSFHSRFLFGTLSCCFFWNTFFFVLFECIHTLYIAQRYKHVLLLNEYQSTHARFLKSIGICSNTYYYKKSSFQYNCSECLAFIYENNSKHINLCRTSV